MIEIRALGYVVYDVTDIAAWRTLTVDAFGMMPSAGPPGAADDGTLWLRLDDRSWRIAVHPSDRDVQVAAGWEVADDQALDQAIAHLRAKGIAIETENRALRDRRGVEGLAGFSDPWGNRHELFWGQAAEEQPFLSPAGVQGFVTEAVGIGHVFYAVPLTSEAVTFYRDAMGFRLTDRFSWGTNSVAFMRTNPRHHSIGIFDLPLPAGPNHLMLEVTRMEDLGKAYDRTMDLKIPIVNSLGQHFNDPTLSFYVRHPSGFNMELGWNATRVVEEGWVARTYNGRGELWGHRGDMMNDIEAAKADD